LKLYYLLLQNLYISPYISYSHLARKKVNRLKWTNSVRNNYFIDKGVQLPHSLLRVLLVRNKNVGDSIHYVGNKLCGSEIGCHRRGEIINGGSPTVGNIKWYRKKVVEAVLTSDVNWFDGREVDQVTSCMKVTWILDTRSGEWWRHTYTCCNIYRNHAAQIKNFYCQTRCIRNIQLQYLVFLKMR